MILSVMLFSIATLVSVFFKIKIWDERGVIFGSETQLTQLFALSCIVSMPWAKQEAHLCTAYTVCLDLVAPGSSKKIPLCFWKITRFPYEKPNIQAAKPRDKYTHPCIWSLRLE